MIACGARESIALLAERLRAASVFVSVLPFVSGFHSPLFAGHMDWYRQFFGAAELREPAVPVWSNVDARPHTDPAGIRGLLVRQVLAPVRWEDTLRGLFAEGVDRFYEIGPGRALAGLLKRVQRKADVRNVTA